MSDEVLQAIGLAAAAVGGVVVLLYLFAPRR
jgi:hypothetical protein